MESLGANATLFWPATALLNMSFPVLTESFRVHLTQDCVDAFAFLHL